MTNGNSLCTDKTPFPTLILGGFGCSKSYNDILSGKSRKYAHSGQMPAFAPPESPKWNERGDIYMLGLTIHCLSQNRGGSDLKNHSPLSPRYKDENLRKLIKECIKTDPHDRPKANDLPVMVHSGYKSWRKKRDDDCRPWGLQHGPVLFAPGSTTCLLSRASPLGLVRAPFST
jgi:hypothetical protein